MASIFEKQNEPELQMLLCAQREVYSRVKKEKCCYLSVSIGLVVFLSFVVLYTRNSNVEAALTLFNAVLIFASTKINEKMNEKQKYAAKIQQYFDAECYNEVSASELIDKKNLFVDSEIAEIQAGVHDKDLSPFMNWYSDYCSFEPLKQVLFCQLENISWDKKLRESFRKGIVLCVIVVLAIYVMYCYKFANSFIEAISILSCLLIMIEYVYDLIGRINKDLKRLRDLSNFVVELEKNTCKSKIQKLQKMLFEHRMQCFLIPDWIYALKKDSMQTLEDVKAELLNKKVSLNKEQ